DIKDTQTVVIEDDREQPVAVRVIDTPSKFVIFTIHRIGDAYIHRKSRNVSSGDRRHVEGRPNTRETLVRGRRVMPNKRDLICLERVGKNSRLTASDADPSLLADQFE